MRLKQLKLAGFKSFANPTTFHFKHTITAIVGPNGCGKSNVIDAIRWVLGESSAKQLRGGAMSDVIFAGTQEKSAKSLASVELVFEHTQGDEHGRGAIHHPLNLYHELSVRRQINKDGKSDYFINGTKVRRRDVIDVFLGTGLGARSYAVIEQGMIGRIIDADAKQLREFIEEASGVSRYQSRREDTQKQLDTARDNLVRLQDMVSELTNQQQRLEKQAKTAKQAQQYQQQLDAIIQQLLVDDYANALQKQQQLLNIYEQSQKEFLIKQNELEQYNQQQKQQQEKIDKIQFNQQVEQQQYQNYWQQQHQAQTAVQQAEQHIQQQQHRQQQLDDNTERLHQQQQQIMYQQQQIEQKIAQLPEQLAELNDKLSIQREQSHSVQQQRKKIVDEITQLTNQKQEQDKQLAVTENTLKNLQHQQNKLQHQQNQYQQALSKWQHACNTLTEHSSSELEQKILSINQTIERLENAIIYRQEQLLDQADEVASLERQFRQQQQQQQAWQTEQQTLQNLLENQKKSLEKTHQPMNVVLPKLFDQLKLNEQGKTFSKQLDKLFSIFSQWVFAENIDKNFIETVQNECAVLTNLALAEEKHLALFDNSTWINFSQIIDFPRLSIFSKIWLNREPMDMSQIQSIWQQLPDGYWLCVHTVDGVVWWLNNQFLLNLNNILQQQKIPIIQHFSQQARIEDLQQLLDNQQPRLQQLQQKLAEETVSLQEWQAQDQQQRNELMSLTKQKQQLTQQQLQQKNHEDKLQQEQQQLQQEQKRLDDEQQQLQENFVKYQKVLQEIQQKLDNIQPVLQQCQQQQHVFDKHREQHRLQQRELEQQYQQLNTQLTKEQLQLEHNQQRLLQLSEEQQRLQHEKQILQENIKLQQQDLPNLQAVFTQYQQQVMDSLQRLEIINNKLNDYKQSQLEQQQQFEQQQRQLSVLQQQTFTDHTNYALAKQNLEKIIESIQEQYAITDLSGYQTALVKNQRKQLQQQQQQLKQQIAELGAVNHTAVAELNEVNQRLEPLTEQIHDLVASTDKLNQAISQIDNQTKQLFMDMLKQVNQELNRLFVQVFGGGQAQLILAENPSLLTGKKTDWQAGLELMAQPKGKKNSRLALLSGGEKTLTALSLVFAIFKQQPAPFCVLDEVDAPLDDANVERFTNLIRELAKEVQFIFISHNKLSMQVADELKGVTMPMAGISKLVSVDLHEVNRYLD